MAKEKESEVGAQMKSYRVHFYAVVRVPYNVQATSNLDAVARAEEVVDFYKDLDVRRGEYGEEVVRTMVDELDASGAPVFSHCHYDQKAELAEVKVELAEVKQMLKIERENTEKLRAPLENLQADLSTTLRENEKLKTELNKVLQELARVRYAMEERWNGLVSALKDAKALKKSLKKLTQER